MAPIQSREEIASSIATGIGNAANSITSGGTVTMDASSEYPGNSTAGEKIPKEAEYASSISGVLNNFVNLIQSTAAEFVAMDNHIASNIDANTSGLPKTSAVPEGDSGFVPNTSYFSEE
ncbi:TIGR04197 family type VII secretion effector [Streptococcus gordonii]|uniref:TIGR04197 family type VII secretion effector n=1 Tax=Streptococcus gordonii TaxID=1302 RepID=UPI000617E54B|nr:TIGR04197 family type VII secretion effector [Streptococcus gordonii]ALD71421.1 type VII secretion protein [Streptococcus gordonii]AOS70547.1 type VII secretion protein [Streptococcus gordonii]